MGRECHGAGLILGWSQLAWPKLVRLFCLFPVVATRLTLAQSCGNVQLQLTPDFSLAVGSSSGGSTYTFSLAGQTLAQGSMTQRALFHFDNSLNSTSGIAPAQSAGTSFAPGKFGSSVAIAAGGTLTYPAAGNLTLGEGTIEMWAAPQYDGSNPLYTTTSQTLFAYNWGPAGNHLTLAVAGGSAYMYVGAANVYAGNLDVSGIGAWRAGEWHHLAFTYSGSHGRIRIYVDGLPAQETDAAINFPSSGPATFSIGGDGSTASAFWIDEVRTSSIEQLPAVHSVRCRPLQPVSRQ